MISSEYLEKLSSLNVDRSSGHPKPHKVCLLLAIMDLIKTGQVQKNQFVINDDLRSVFSSQFEHLKKGNDAENINLPFYHLQNDGIWHFKISEGKQSAYDDLINKPGTPSVKSINNVIDFAYLDPELFDYFTDESSRVHAKEALLENLDDLSDQFNRWLLAMGKSDRTAASYVGAIKGTISNWAEESNISKQNLIAIQSYSKISRIAEELATYEVFKDKNQIGKQMYSAALNAYKDFLSITCQVEASEDIEEIIRDESIDSTQKAMLVNTRVGQGKFREGLIEYWGGCAVTGYQSTQFLVASHIKPWRAANDNERLDKYNGILLLPNLDKVFDLGYISFTDKGQIQKSEFIESPDTLGIYETMKINITDQHQDYLAYHREVIFEKKI